MQRAPLPECWAILRAQERVQTLTANPQFFWRFVLQVKHDLAKLQLTSPVCTKEQEKIALSRRVEKHWRLIGWGQIQKGLKLNLPSKV